MKERRGLSDRSCDNGGEPAGQVGPAANHMGGGAKGQR